MEESVQVLLVNLMMFVHAGMLLAHICARERVVKPPFLLVYGRGLASSDHDSPRSRKAVLTYQQVWKLMTYFAVSWQISLIFVGH